MKAIILWIEGRQAEGLPLINTLRKKGYELSIVGTGSEALERLPSVNPDLIVVNAASLRSSGRRICSTLRKQAGNLPIVLIVDRDHSKAFKEECADAVLELPFTPRKLINWIVPFLPWVGEQTLQRGPIRLDMERRCVECNGKLTRLTPSLTHLLRIFMEHQGEVLVREDIFRQVWETDYTGDTRTLDVHISWLRQAIEKDPHEPAYLKTIRGVGYRLDV